MDKFVKVAVSMLLVFGLFSCQPKVEKLVMVWYPNESSNDLKGAREEFGKLIEKATGKTVEHKLTTDYTIAIETLVSGNAQLGFFGPQGYVEAHKKNPKVKPLVVNSGASGTLADAVYYSWLAVLPQNADSYKKDGNFTIDNIVGKKMSFVSTSSTSGYKVPASNIVAFFKPMDLWKNLKQEDLLEGGKDKFFSEVLFGSSHQGSAVNLLSGKAELAAFCDTCVANYVDLVSGEHNKVGATYKVKTDAADPFTTYKEKTFQVISSTPVLNSPFVYNSSGLSEADAAKLVTLLTSDETASNTSVFVPKANKDVKGIFAKTKNERFLVVEDAFFNPVRDLSK